MTPDLISEAEKAVRIEMLAAEAADRHPGGMFADGYLPGLISLFALAFLLGFIFYLGRRSMATRDDAKIDVHGRGTDEPLATSLVTHSFGAAQAHSCVCSCGENWEDVDDDDLLTGRDLAAERWRGQQACNFECRFAAALPGLVLNKARGWNPWDLPLSHPAMFASANQSGFSIDAVAVRYGLYLPDSNTPLAIVELYLDPFYPEMLPPEALNKASDPTVIRFCDRELPDADGIRLAVSDGLAKLFYDLPVQYVAS